MQEIESLKNEIASVQSKELHAETRKQEQLSEQLEFYSNQQEENKRLQEEVHHTKTVYEQQILNLKKQLEASSESKREEIIKLQDVIESNSQCYQNEIDRLNEELATLKSIHQEEMSQLKNKLDTLPNTYQEEQKRVDQLIEQHRVKEESMEEELRACKEKYECELEYLRQAVIKNEDNHIETRNVQLEKEMAEKSRHLENALKELESQYTILQDELTYMNNVKMKLEMEIQHAKDEYFHEREDLEFKINELQLAKEDYCGMTEKLKSELQATREQHEKTIKEHSVDIQNLIEKHEREICEFKQTLSSSSERENLSLAFEIQGLKEQCQKHLEEKEEAIASYESLRETLEVLQTELGESAGKISREFESMKQQQASDVDELQKKLRATFNEKDVLRETVNRLQEEVEQLSSQRGEMEELRQKTEILQEENEQLVASLQQSEAAIKEVAQRENVLISENGSLLDEAKCAREKIDNLQEQFRGEQAKVVELQQQTEALGFCRRELEKQSEDLREQLKGITTEKGESQQKLRALEQQVEAHQRDRDRLSSEIERLQNENRKIKDDRERTSEAPESITSEQKDWLASKEHSESLEMKLQKCCEEKDGFALLLEKEKAFKLLVFSQLHDFLEQMGSKYPEENEGYDVTDLLHATNESLAKMKQEVQTLALQRDENVTLQQEIKRLQEENVSCCMELRSLLEDHEKEKCLLREELEGALSEKEALQLDIQELKHASEKVKNENEGLLVHIEDISGKLAFHESEMKEQQEKWEEEEKNLNILLGEKETELRRVQAELSLLKVRLLFCKYLIYPPF